MLAKTIALIDALNSKDPHSQELLYSQRMTDMLGRFAPTASDALKIACRGQHIERWKTPRDSYPKTREGYLRWRVGLYKYHSERVGEVMQKAGYTDSQFIGRVKNIVGKYSLKKDPEAQTLEDVAALVFIEHYMLPFTEKNAEYSEEKWMNIIKKTWNKMSPAARDFVTTGNLKVPESLMPLILKSIQ